MAFRSIHQKNKIEDNAEDSDQYEAEAEITETEEEEQSSDTEETESIPTEPVRPTTFLKAKRVPAASAPTITPQAVTSASTSKSSDTRVYLTAKIDRELRSRLKVHSYRVHKSIVRVLEEMIAEHIPEA